MMKVLLPIDGSDCAMRTLAWASGFLSPRRVRIYLLHVIPQSSVVPPTEHEVRDARHLLAEAQHRMTEACFTVVSAEYVVGDPARAICAYADEAGIDQIVLGSHGRQGLARFLMGSISADVFKMARQPVLVLNNGDRPSLRISHIDQVHLVES